VIVVGAGENAELGSNHLFKAGISDLVIANCDVEKAREVVEEFVTTLV
jgi:glutamyl-tRNA reductase